MIKRHVNGLKSTVHGAWKNTSMQKYCKETLKIKELLRKQQHKMNKFV